MNQSKDVLKNFTSLPALFPTIKPAKDEKKLVTGFYKNPALSEAERRLILVNARKIAASARQSSRPFSAEKIMAIYKLSTAEGRMIMELAEALLRVPDSTTRDLLIFDKLSPGHWLNSDAKGFFWGMKSALQLAGGIVSGKYDDRFTVLVSKLGVPTVRHAIEAAMRQMGGQFVFAETIDEAVKTTIGADTLFSFDMLGEAARSIEDCDRYHAAYSKAINAVGAQSKHDDVNKNSGVSIKLSALNCRFQIRYWRSSKKDLINRMVNLAIAARRYNIPLMIDAEECGKLKPTLHVFERLLAHSELEGWSGLGIVVQAYSRAAGPVISWLESLAKHHRTKISVRLVKGAYWDTEIKLAQEKGMKDFPVYTLKNHTDLAYLAHAKQLMKSSRYFHPQFASHNAYTLSALACLTKVAKPISYEIQKLHGMGNQVHSEIKKISSAPLRVYAPVGRHHDLLAYLIRRIIENGASSSFMNRLADNNIDIQDVVVDPYNVVSHSVSPPMCGDQIFFPERKNSVGFDVEDVETVHDFEISTSQTELPPLPAVAGEEDVANAFKRAQLSSWKLLSPTQRATIIDNVADRYEEASGDIFQLLVHEAGKTIDDAASELREAIDFCRYYAAQARLLDTVSKARGTVVAISPWNFPLAIFTGQIAAALGAGNVVLAKPAEQTPRIAALAVLLMHRSGVPKDGVQLLCGAGGTVGHDLTKAGLADMVVFTGSTQTAKKIEYAIAQSNKPHAPLIAETGGLNAMIVDGSALLERAVDDILISSFRSAGQRCSALRILYAQEEIAPALLTKVCEAAAALKIGDASEIGTDIGPVIDLEGKRRIDRHVALAKAGGRLIWQGEVPKIGCFCPPSIIKVDGITDLETETFGPVLHVATYEAGSEKAVVEEINSCGFGLTFGIHSRIDTNIEIVSTEINVGNIYINRNQVGAVVGSQPFGGRGLSGTGPKAGGPAYMRSFLSDFSGKRSGEKVLKSLNLFPGPSGERNAYSVVPRGRVLIIHPDTRIRKKLARVVRSSGNLVQECDVIPERFDGVDAVMTNTEGNMNLRNLRMSLQRVRKGIIPLITDKGGNVWLHHEKHICQDMTATGGNLDLLMK